MFWGSQKQHKTTPCNTDAHLAVWLAIYCDFSLVSLVPKRHKSIRFVCFLVHILVGFVLWRRIYDLQAGKATNFRDRGNLNSLTGKRHYYSTMNIFNFFFQLSDRFIMRLTIIIALIGLTVVSSCRVEYNGCSVPRHLPKPWINTMTPSCNKHDVCYYCVSNFYLNG